MHKTPNMNPELFDAIETCFSDDEDILVDIYLYLTDLDEARISNIRYVAEQSLEDMGRCGRCGEKLKTAHYRQQHNELEGCPYEDMFERYCPNCDLDI